MSSIYDGDIFAKKMEISVQTKIAHLNWSCPKIPSLIND